MSVNFTLPTMPRSAKRLKPDIFAASAFFVLALSGLYITPYLTDAVSGFLNLSESTHAAFSQLLYYAAFMLFPILFYMRKNLSAVDTVRINPLSGSSAALCVAAAVLGVFLLNILTSLWMILIESVGGTLTDTSMKVPKTSSALIGTLVFSAILPGISEELLFRGAILGAWEEKGSVKAMLISAIWFTCIHASVEGLPAEFISGLILAFIVISTDSLIAGMIYHTVHNSLCLILAFIGQRAAENAEVTANTHLSMLESMGGLSGVVSLLMPAAFLGLLLVLVLKKLDKKRLRQNRFNFGYPPAPARDFSIQEYAVMGSGFAIVSILYLADFLKIAGWL